MTVRALFNGTFRELDHPNPNPLGVALVTALVTAYCVLRTENIFVFFGIKRILQPVTACASGYYTQLYEHSEAEVAPPFVRIFRVGWDL